MTPQRTDIRSEFGARLRSLRKHKGWSQETLAERAELHPTYVSGIERGARNVSLVNLARLAEALEVTLAELLECAAQEDAVLANLRRLIAGDDRLALEFFRTYCGSCLRLERALQEKGTGQREGKGKAHGNRVGNGGGR